MGKANRKTLMAVKRFFEEQEGWDLDELKNEIIHKTNLLKVKSMGDRTLATDECMVVWDKEDACGLDELIDAYTDEFIKSVCNVLDSFVGEELEDMEY